jgi:hypothetical protein
MRTIEQHQQASRISSSSGFFAKSLRRFHARWSYAVLAVVLNWDLLGSTRNGFNEATDMVNTRLNMMKSQEMHSTVYPPVRGPLMRGEFFQVTSLVGDGL